MNIVEFCKERKLTLSSAESFCGGGYGNHVTNIAGSSNVYIGGIICYDTKVKINLLHVDEELINKYSVVSYECCEAMCKNCLKIFNSDIAVSFTGLAGPTDVINPIPQLSYVGVCSKDKCIIEELHLIGTREEIKNQAIKIVNEIIFKNF